MATVRAYTIETRQAGVDCNSDNSGIEDETLDLSASFSGTYDCNSNNSSGDVEDETLDLSTSFSGTYTFSEVRPILCFKLAILQ